MEIIWKEADAPYFAVLSHDLPEGTEENNKNHKEDSRRTRWGEAQSCSTYLHPRETKERRGSSVPIEGKPVNNSTSYPEQ